MDWLKVYMYLIAALYVIPGMSLAKVNPDYYDEQEQGWHWYHEEKLSKMLDKRHIADTKATQSQPSPLEILHALQEEVDTAKAKAVLYPTPENIKSYIVIQNKVSENAHHFADTWASVLLYHPELNYRLANPVNQSARHVYLDEQGKQQNEAIAKLAETTGLFFFYKGTCPYCRQFAPVLREFSEATGLSIIPITMDGLILPEFPDSQVDNGQAEKFHITKTPALFTVNPYTGKAIPVAYGMVSQTELQERILQIIKEGK